MSRIAGIIATVAMCVTGVSFSQKTPQLISLALLTANPQSYAGQTVAVHGVIDQSNPDTGSFKLVEGKTLNAAKLHAPALLVARSKGDQSRVVQNGQEAIVLGQIKIQDNAPILLAANIITDKGAIRSFIVPSERRPRPGDNLGHDAQPSGSIAE
jgi:hypothetical protein